MDRFLRLDEHPACGQWWNARSFEGWAYGRTGMDWSFDNNIFKRRKNGIDCIPSALGWAWLPRRSCHSNFSPLMMLADGKTDFFPDKNRTEPIQLILVEYSCLRVISVETFFILNPMVWNVINRWMELSFFFLIKYKFILKIIYLFIFNYLNYISNKKIFFSWMVEKWIIKIIIKL